VRPVTFCLELVIDTAQHRFVEESSKQRVMACTGLMHASEQHVDDPEFGPGADPVRRHTNAGSHKAIAVGGGFEGAHDSRAYGDDAAAACLGRKDRIGRRPWNPIGLIKRQALVEVRIAG
jgi:hypothetical protein